MHDLFKQDWLELVFETTTRMSADIFTKPFTDVLKWKKGLLAGQCYSFGRLGSTGP